MVSLSTLIGWDSQKPIGLSGAAGINVAGSAYPQSDRTRVNAEVPLRCIPSTMIAVRLDLSRETSLAGPRSTREGIFLTLVILTSGPGPTLPAFHAARRWNPLHYN